MFNCPTPGHKLADIAVQHCDLLYRIAVSILKDHQLAEDVVQEVLLKVMLKAEQFEARRELKPWLCSIARRTAIDILRRSRRCAAISMDDFARES